MEERIEQAVRAMSPDKILGLVPFISFRDTRLRRDVGVVL